MEIKKSLGRFLSIFFIVALGVSFFAGIRASEPDMRLSGDEYFDEWNLADMKIVSTMGLTEKDAESLKTISGVEALESGYSVDAMCKIEDTKKGHSCDVGSGDDESSVGTGRTITGESE